MSGNYVLHQLPCAITPRLALGAKGAYPTDFVIEHLLKLSIYLIGLCNISTMFARISSNPYMPTLYTLLERLESKQLGPSRLPFVFQSDEHIKSRIHMSAKQEAANRPLADFEDIYYALLALMQELSQLIHLRIESGFNDANSLVSKGGPTLAELHECLTEYWDIFNDPRCAKALDDAVREARVQAIRDELVLQYHTGKISCEEVDEQLWQLYSPDVYNGVLGMHFVCDWAPAIVGMYLKSKYRAMFDVEEQDDVVQENRQRRKAMRRAQREALNGQPTQDVAEQLQDVAEEPQSGFKPLSALDYAAKFHDALGEHDSPEEQARADAFLQRFASLTMADKPDPVYGIQPNYQPLVERYPEYRSQIHNRKYDEEFETDLDTMLQWQLRCQRVSEYTNYLRSRQSHDLQQVLDEASRRYISDPSLADGFTGDSTVGWGFWHMEMDMVRL